MLVIQVGRHAVLAEVADVRAALALAHRARAAGLEAREVVPGARTVLFDGVRDPAALQEQLVSLEARRGERPAEPPGEVIEVPVRYDGVDLEEVADHWSTSAEGAAVRHSSIEFVAAFCGFAPGFSYLAGLPDELAVPRLSTPRPRVAAGSVAVAGAWCGIYPAASPGGWRVIGTTDVLMWDAERDPPALLAPGTRVRFVPR